MRKKEPLLVMAALLTACSHVEEDNGGQWRDVEDDDTICDGCPDTGVRDTGVAAIFWLADFETADGVFTSAHLGLGAYGLREEDWACTIQGELAWEADAAVACPGCEWAFDLSPVTNDALTGDRCDGFFLDSVFFDDAIDGYFDWSWGFASAYTYYGADGTAYPLDESVFLDPDGTGWSLFAFNEGTRHIAIEGDATSFSLLTPVSDGAAKVYYYYYL